VRLVGDPRLLEAAAAHAEFLKEDGIALFRSPQLLHPAPSPTAVHQLLEASFTWVLP
jgi:hypothetical protein